MLKLTGTLVGKSEHRDGNGGFTLTFLIQGQEFKIRVSTADGAKFKNTADLVHPKEGSGQVMTVHSEDLRQYSFVIDELVKPKPVPPPAPPVAPVAPVKPAEKPTT